MPDVDLDAYRTWTPAAQQRALSALQSRTNDSWRPFYCQKPNCDGNPHDATPGTTMPWEWNHARADQHPPKDPDWLTWLITSGRGAGKTRTGSELTHQMTEVTGRIAVIAATGADVRDTCLEGESGILTIARPNRRPKYEPSKRRLTWPNGCIATTFSAEEPDRLRGPEHGFAWWDEPAHAPLVQEGWDNLLFGLRVGTHPRICLTTTPKPRPWLKGVIADHRTRLTVTSTYANLANLAPTYAEQIVARYEGTRLGRQELHGEILEDVEGALWSWEMIEASRVVAAPEMVRIVVGVDPAGSSRVQSDETGIVVVGRDAVGDVYVLDDRSGRYSPLGWATAAHHAYLDHEADAIVAETNFGADMVASTIRSSGFSDRLITVHARRAKDVRAEPIVGLWEQGRAHIVGTMPELEAQLVSWVPYAGDHSPDRLDAMVYAATIVAQRPGHVEVVSPTHLHITSAGLPGIGRGQ
jgi:phage terminase large subunit-like protein